MVNNIAVKLDFSAKEIEQQLIRLESREIGAYEKLPAMPEDIFVPENVFHNILSECFFLISYDRYYRNFSIIFGCLGCILVLLIAYLSYREHLRSEIL